MIYVEQLDLGRCRKCLGKNTYNIVIRKDTADDVVKVSHRLYKRKSFPIYVKRVLNVLSKLVLPSIYYKECVIV